MKNDKKVTLDYYTLEPTTTINEKREEYKKAIKNGLLGLAEEPNFPPLNIPDNKVSFWGKIKKDQNFITGSLIKTQISDIPPTHNTRTHEIKPLPIGDDDGLATVTCFFIDVELLVVMIQSFKNSVSVSHLCQILKKNLNLPGFMPSVVINAADYNAFMKMNTIRKLEVRIARVENGTVFSEGKNKSVKQITNSADGTNMVTLDYKIITRKKDESLAVAFVKSVVNDLQLFKHTKEVEILKVEGFDEDAGIFRPIDFIKQRMKDTTNLEKQRLVGKFFIEEQLAEMKIVYSKQRPGLLLMFKKIN